MGTNSLQASKKRSFHLPSFIRRSSAEPARNAEDIARSAEEVAQVQKAAAWQWYTRGVGEAVVPTKRPSVPNSQAPSDENNGVKGISKGGESVISSSNIVQQKKTAEPPQLAPESPRTASRFKAEATVTRPTSSAPLPTLSAPLGGPSTPLYDDVELSGLRTQMADFVQRLQNQHSIKDNEQFPAVGDHQKSKPPPCPSAPSLSIDHQQTKAPPVAAASSSDHLLATLPPAPVASTVPLHMRPFSALHRFFRKVVTGSIAKSTNNSPQLVDSPTVVHDPEVLIPEDHENEDTTQYHYHHYIHHHHHHYHYAESPEEQARAVIRSRRRHSENSGIRPHIPSPWEAESDEEEDEAEENPIEAYLARRRRHSDSFAGHLQPKKADFHEDEGMKEESVKAASPMQFSRRYSSERFSPNKIPTLVNREIGQKPAAERKDGSFDEFLASRRTRHSAEYYWEEASVERMTEVSGKSAGAPGGGKSAGGAYKLGGAAGGGTQATPEVRRRHSTGGSRMPEAEMGKRSPSARYYLDVLDHHIAPANATPTHHAAFPPLYPQKPARLVH